MNLLNPRSQLSISCIKLLIFAILMLLTIPSSCAKSETIANPNANSTVEKSETSDSNPSSGKNLTSINTDGTECLEEEPLNDEPGSVSDEIEICKTVSDKSMHTSLLKLLQDPQQTFSGKDIACILLNLLERNTDYSATIKSLESRLKETTGDIQNIKITAQQSNIAIENLQNSSKSDENLAENYKKLESKLDYVIKQQNSTKKQETNRPLLKEFETMNKTLNTLLQSTQMSELQLAIEDWNDKGHKLTKIVEELGSRTSKTELEIVYKIYNISDRLFELQSEIRNETSRAKNEEGKLDSKISEEISENQNFIKDFEHYKSVNLAKVTQEWSLYKEKLDTDLKNASKSMQEMLLSPFKLMESLESQLQSKIQSEISRASLVETGLKEIVQNQTISLKSSLDNEILRATFAENTLQKFIIDQGSYLEVVDDLKAQMNIESLRTKGTEAQLSSIITKHVERTKLREQEILASLTNLESIFENKLKKDESIETKLGEEISRASNAELGLLGNINQELKRASEREEELYKLFANYRQRVEKLGESLATLKTDLGNDTVSRVKSIESVEGQNRRIKELEITLESLTSQEATRAKKAEEYLENKINLESERLISFEKSRKDFINNFESCSNSTEKLSSKIQTQEHNLTLISESVQSLEKLLRSEVNKVEISVGETDRNFSKHLLTLADEMDKKLEILNEGVKSRLETVDADIKLLRNSNDENQNQNQGVFNRVLGLFGSGRRRVNNSKGNSTRTTKARPVFKNEATNLSIASDNKNVKRTVDSGRNGGGGGGRAIIPIQMVQRSNSKVRNIFG